jgi:hypothetical protein
MQKFFTFVSISILLFCSYNLNTEEIRYIHKIANEEYFTVQNAYAEQFGDSIMFWSTVVSPKPDSVLHYDSTKYDSFIMTYHNGKFDSLGIKKIIGETIGNYSFLGQITKGSNGDIVFGFAGGALYKLSNGEIIRYDSLIKALKINKINSLAIDNSNELYVQFSNKILKFGNDKVDTIVDGSFDRYYQPHPFLIRKLYFIGNNLYYGNFKDGLASYNTQTKAIDSVPLHDNLSALINGFSSFYIISQFEDYLNLVLKTNAGLNHFARFYPETNKIELLDYIMNIATSENLPNDKLFYQGFDKNKNCYLQFQAESLLDSFYVVSPDQSIKRYCAISDSFPYHDGFDISKPSVLSNGDVIIPASRGLFVIPAKGTSVETPKNLIFMKNLYPNPARDRIKVDFAVESVNLSSTKLEIYDYLGRLALEANPEVEYNSSTGNGTMTCDISQLHTGFYIAVLTNGKYKRSTPLFVE